MLTLYSSPNTRGMRITWMLEELDLDYEYHLIDFSKGDSQSPDFLAINPAGKVPALKDNDLVMTESAAIVTYLGDNYGSGELVPKAGTQQRGLYDQWCYFALCELEQGLWTIGKHRFAIPKQYRLKEVIPTGEWEFQKALGLLSQALDNQDYILGDNFTAADILLGQTLIWAEAFEQPLPQDNIKAYLNRIKQRPALAAAMTKEAAAT